MYNKIPFAVDTYIDRFRGFSRLPEVTPTQEKEVKPLPHRRNIWVKDSQDNFLFRLGGKNVAPSDTLTLNQAYDRGLQWQAPSANYYAPLDSINPQIRELETINHLDSEKLYNNLNSWWNRWDNHSIKPPLRNTPPETDKYNIYEVNGMPVPENTLNDVNRALSVYKGNSRFFRPVGNTVNMTKNSVIMRPAGNNPQAITNDIRNQALNHIRTRGGGSFQNFPLFENPQRRYRVVDSQNNRLFNLGDPSGPHEDTLTARQIYDKRLQWFAPQANDYIPIDSINPDIVNNKNVNHVDPENFYTFVNKSRPPYDYAEGMPGDWKNVKGEGNESFLSEMYGVPIWTDALGQIPFAVDTYKTMLGVTGNHEKAK